MDLIQKERHLIENDKKGNWMRIKDILPQGFEILYGSISKKNEKPRISKIQKCR